MRKPSWRSVERQMDSIEKLSKRRAKASLFFKEELKDGEVYDPLKNTIVVIADCQDSTLRRIYKTLNAMYKSINVKEIDKRNILSKKMKEIEKELESK